MCCDPWLRPEIYPHLPQTSPSCGRCVADENVCSVDAVKLPLQLKISFVSVLSSSSFPAVSFPHFLFSRVAWCFLSTHSFKSAFLYIGIESSSRLLLYHSPVNRQKHVLKYPRNGDSDSISQCLQRIECERSRRGAS